ncbi:MULTISPECIES: DEAD/DEAH box helicase [unclassified Herbaspirillum]|uniref:DEAD/DEAH box helicase n=1 Tax=unclassified Herbaspirillum TaxID=2624150 RepID=UPI001152D325|nr:MULTISPECIES: DEAD/DEAH box helicase [unclassified Herbaspirillum]MBB5391433.1 superfamily II DNA/RNA helicase [Herbaspirillum sp. SJZ102]TQK12882.1 superfamily II DNA/RNA helicase [Herbaspirillum sp. SJZ130]TQK14886.1 superfamily II DNA/RNA helicase [Herbaspirillum sp. SJZ106]TWC67241.1 superfamily II DNA/RNA helicase [Herbaspirillum sp. SJZ099]
MSDTTSASAASTAPAVRFEDFGLSPDILKALAEQGYVHPTPIQAQAIPVVLQGRDVMGAAQTGTGKTAGFSLPIIQRLLAYASTSVSPARHPVRALILTPTRELADQVAENVKAYSRFTPLRSTVVFGGIDMAPQTAALRAGVEIVIATPGRLLDHVQQKTVNLSQTQILVMDEADRMLDMGFLPDLQRIINLLPKQRQNLMFSATFSPEIKKLAASFQNNPVTIEVARSNATAETVTQTIYKVDESAKLEAVTHIIRERGLKQVIVFSNTKIGASRLSRQLESDGIKASAIHGDKSQSERMAALEAFKQGQIEVLVATDVAARGLDIAELPCVINYDLPYNAEDYVHRIGRTGRAGASGDAISLFCDKDERLLVDIEKLIKKKFERAELAGFVPRTRERHERAERGERSVRGERSERAGRPERSERSRDGGAPVSRREKVDPWFLKPYEPTGAAEVSTKPEILPKSNRPKPKVAALLGGMPKR